MAGARDSDILRLVVCMATNNVRKVSLQDSEIVHAVGLLALADIVAEVLPPMELLFLHSFRVVRMVVQRE